MLSQKPGQTTKPKKSGLVHFLASQFGIEINPDEIQQLFEMGKTQLPAIVAKLNQWDDKLEAISSKLDELEKRLHAIDSGRTGEN